MQTAASARAAKRVQLCDRAQLVDVLDGLGGVALGCEHRHAECLGQPGDLDPDRPRADDEQRLAAQLAVCLLVGRPVPAGLVALHPAQLLGEREQAEHRELGERVPAWVPLAVQTRTRSRAARSSSSASATCWPAPALRAWTQRSAGPPAMASTSACGEAPGHAEEDLRAAQQLPPASRVGREVPRDVAHVTRDGHHERVVEQIDALVDGGDALGEVRLEGGVDQHDRHGRRRAAPRRRSPVRARCTPPPSRARAPRPARAGGRCRSASRSARLPRGRSGPRG
jgi:hypothetical protein